jgi:hypothetical protein
MSGAMSLRLHYAFVVLTWTDLPFCLTVGLAIPVHPSVRLQQYYCHVRDVALLIVSKAGHSPTRHMKASEQ